MEFKSFLTQAKKEFFWHNKQNFLFQGTVYPYSFFALLLDFLSKKQVFCSSIKKIHGLSCEQKKIMGMLIQSILGDTGVYWLGDMSLGKKNKAQEKLLSFLADYEGPHTILFFVNDKTKVERKNNTLITIKNTVTHADFFKILDFFELDLNNNKRAFVRTLFDAVSSLSLDFACSLINYLELIHAKYLDNFLPYVINLCEAEPALSQLSEHFFAKKSRAFFLVWSKIGSKYPEMFWLAYWSEQVFKAYHVKKFLQEKQFGKAKQMSFRLPFTFMKRDWKLCSLPYLSNLYEELYAIDFAIKKGSTFYSLDLFYFKHFLQK